MLLLMKIRAMVVHSVLNVLKSGCTVFLLMILFLGCKSTIIEQNQSKEHSYYTLDKFQKQNNLGKTVVLRFYDYENNNRPIPVYFAIINGIVLKDSIYSFASELQEVSIKTSVHLKKDLLIEKLKLNKGDSIIVNAHLVNHNTVFE